MDCSLPGSSIHGIFQARVLEWGAIAFSLPPRGIHKNISRLEIKVPGMGEGTQSPSAENHGSGGENDLKITISYKNKQCKLEAFIIFWKEYTNHFTYLL